MIRELLGDWGSTLDDDEYASALAALGVLRAREIRLQRPSADPVDLVSALQDEFARGDRTPVWPLANLVDVTTIPSGYDPASSDPVALAKAWREFRKTIQHERELPRIAIPFDRHDPAVLLIDDLRALLQRLDVGLNALVLAKPRATPEPVAWHWPLRVGVPDDVEHAGILAALRDAQRQRPWVEQLSRCFTVGTTRDSCDMLILAAAAAQRVDGRQLARLRASVVVCLEDPPRDRTLVDDRYLELRDRLHAAAVAAVGRFDDPGQQLGAWFAEVLRHVSHDVPIHAALWSVGRHFLLREPMVVGSPEALDTCRILAIAEHQDRIVEMMMANLHLDEERGRGPSVPGGEPTFGGPAPGGPQGSFAEELRAWLFTSEVADGMRVSKAFEKREREIDDAKAPRWIQANAWRDGAQARALAPEQWNLLSVHIGPSALQRDDAPFPDSRVDFTRGDVAVTVQLELAAAAVKALDTEAAAKSTPALVQLVIELEQPPENPDDVAVVGLASTEITLPPVGHSSKARFAVFPQTPTGQLEGRIAIIHKNRVLQTARVTVDVDKAADRGNGVVVRSESVIHPADEDLSERRKYDVPIQVSDVGGKLHLTIERNGRSVAVQLDDLAEPIGRISKGLERAAENWDYAQPMFVQPVFRKTLYTLAAAGAELEQHLREHCGNDIDRWGRIHLVPYTNQFFPLEYVYDGPPPDPVAAPCPNLFGALDRGSCEHALETAGSTAPCPNRRDDAFLCPMHFWGFRKLIERNGVVTPIDEVSPGSSPTKRIIVPSKGTYCKVNSLLFAASDRAFLYAADDQARKAERTNLVKALDLFAPSTVLDATDWDQWRALLGKQPNLLVLVAHTDDIGSPVLEIGKRKLLGRQQIVPGWISPDRQPRLLILLGCSSAGVTEDFQPYPQRFRGAGISIVLAPVASIRGADAVPIAKRLAQLLAENLHKPDPVAFGQLMPLLRRQLLRDGHPGVMGIVGFGDGDWLLGGQPC